MGLYLCNEIMIISNNFMIFTAFFPSCFLFCFLFHDHPSLTVHVHKLECRVKRFLCCIQDYGLGEGSELQ